MIRFILLGSVFALVFAQQNSSKDPVSFTDQEKEKFLKTGTIADVKEIGHGVTKPLKADLTLDGVKHSAQIQTVDKDLSDFFPEDGSRPVAMKDSWRFNVAAYRMDRLLGMNMTPPTVARPYKAKPAGFTWWADDVWMEEVERRKQDLKPPNAEDFEKQLADGRVFDELILNIDRNLSNLLISHQWKVILIDHSRSFTPYGGIRNKANLTRVTKRMLDALRGLTEAKVTAAVDTYLTKPEAHALIERRDKIVAYFEKLAKDQGEGNVLYP